MTALERSKELQIKIDAWKDQFGKVKGLTFEDGKVIYYRMPTYLDLKRILSLMNENSTDYKYSIIENLYLGGDLSKDEVKAKEEYLTGAVEHQ